MNTDLPANRTLRAWHRASLSLSAALAVVAILLHASNYLSGRFLGWMISLNTVLHFAYRHAIGEYLAFLVWSAAATLFVLLLFRIVDGRNSTILHYSGPLELSIPAVCFVVIWYFQPDHFLGARDLGLLVPEMVLAWVSAILFYVHKWPISSPTSIVLVAVHCVVWCRAYYITFAFRAPYLLAIPLVASASVLLWGLTRRADSQSIQ